MPLLIKYIVYSFLILLTSLLAVLIYSLFLNKKKSEIFFNSLNKQYFIFFNEKFVSWICLTTNFMSQILLLSSDIYIGFFFGMLSFFFLTFKLISCTITYSLSLNTFSSYSNKKVKKSVQTALSDNQNLLFFWLMLCNIGFLYRIYYDFYAITISVALWGFSYFLTWLSIKKDFLLFEKAVLVLLFVQGVILLHDGPWYAWGGCLFFLIYQFNDKSIYKQKLLDFKRDFIEYSLIFEERYITELYLFYILKRQSWLFLVIFFVLPNVLNFSIEGILGACSGEWLEIILIFKLHVWLNILSYSLLDIIKNITFR